MRVTGIAVGVAVGLALGFALHEWMARDDAMPREAPPRTVQGVAAPSATAARSLPLTQPAPVAEPASLPAAADVAGLSGGSSAGAAADALVGILVYGAVLDMDGRPVKPGDRNWLYFDTGKGRREYVEVGKSSTYAKSGLSPGELTVISDLSGFRPFRQSLELTAERPVVRLDVVLQPAVVLLVKGFTPSGERLSDAIVRDLGRGEPWSAPRLSAVATREKPAGDLPEISDRGYNRWGIGTYTDRWEDDRRGASVLPLDALGRLELDEPLPAYVSLLLRHVLVATQRVEPGAEEVVFTVPIGSLQTLLGTVRLRVESAETHTVPADVTAALSDSQTSGGGDTPDEKGNFLWEQQRPGLLELSISATGHETWEQEVSVPVGGTADLGTIALTAATSVSGVVVDGDGKPVSIGLQALRDDLDVGLGMDARRYARSNAEGAFQIEGLGKHRYRVVVSAEDRTSLPVFVDARNGDVTGVRVMVETGATLRVRVQGTEGERYGLRVATSDGIVVSFTDDWPADWPWTKRLPSGAYTVALLRDGKELKRVPVTIAAEDVALDIGP